MKRHSPRLIAGLAMLSLGFFDGILGVAWLAIHQSVDTRIESIGVALALVGGGSALGSALAPYVLKTVSHLTLLKAALVTQCMIMLILGLSESLVVFAALYGVRGVANGFAHASLNAFFAPRMTGAHLMNVHGGWGIGIASAGLTTGWILSQGFDWWIPYALGGLLTLIAVCCLWVARPTLHGLMMHSSDDSSAFSGISAPMICAILGGFVYVGLEQGVGNWISVVMVAMHAVDAGFAGLATGLFWSALTLGRFTLGLIRLPEHQILIGASGCVLISLACLPFAPAYAQIGLYVLTGLAMAPIAPFILVFGARMVPAGARDAMLSMQIVSFSAGAAVIPALFGVVATEFSIERVLVGFVGVACLLLIAVVATLKNLENRC